jgi:TatD DNase family protein
MSLEFIDTHCHIHEDGYPEPLEALKRAKEAGIIKLLCVGTGIESSKQALAFAAQHDDVYATIGVHPHDTKDGWDQIADLASSVNKLVAIGEIGLDYFYNNSPRETQIQALKDQLQVAVDHNLLVTFHVREAFEDFWPIFDSFHYADGSNVRGVLHSFTDTYENLQKALERGLYIGVNGISTFTKDAVQQSMFAAIPLEKMVLETDAPFLTPSPFRGKINEPAFVRNVAEHFVETYRPNEGLSTLDIAQETTANARALFTI